MTAPVDPSELRKRADISGAAGVPIGIAALLLALLPVLGPHIAWAPGAAAVALGAIGVWRGRRGRGNTWLSGTALGLGLGSFFVTGGWLEH